MSMVGERASLAASETVMVKKTSAQVFRQLLPMTFVGLAASFILFGIVLHLERGNAESRFRELAEQRIIAIRANIAIAQDSINLLAGHFAVSPPHSTSRDGFRMLVAQTVSDHTFVQGFSWDPRIGPDDIVAFEEKARRDGLLEFRITERDADGNLRPVGHRQEYIPIYYMEPMATNLRALGFDLASNPVRRQALHSGRDKGRPEATGRITLVQEYGDQYGILVLAPVFGGMGPRDVASNRQNLTGYVSGVFRIGDLINSSAAGAAVANVLPLVDIHLFDMSAVEGERRLYPKSDARPPEAMVSGLHVGEAFTMAERNWLLIARPSEAFLVSNRPVAAFAMLVVALLATGFYLSFLKGRITQAEHAIAFAREVDRAKRRLGEAQKIARLVSMELDPVRGLFVAGDGVAEMLGFGADHECGTVETLLANVHPEDRPSVAAALRDAAKAAVEVEFRVVHDGGSVRTVQAVAGELPDDGRSLITLQDVTARKVAEEEKAAMIERIAESDRFEALGTLAGGIAHEINTPTQYVGDNINFMKGGLDSLLGFAQTARAAVDSGGGLDLLGRKLDDLDLDFLQAELPAAADQALDGTERIARIVQAIKEFSYPSSKSPHPVDLNHMVDVVATVTRNQWKYVAEMDCDFDRDLPKISAIEGEINQVLVNLIVNATQAIGERGDGVLGRITVSTKGLGSEVEISVADTGIGIAPENLKQIFEMFFTTKAPGQGTGQGLAITKAIIHRHGGRITVESEPGSGSCFRIRLPVTPPDSVCRPMDPPQGA